MATQAPDLDSAVRGSNLELESRDFPAPEVLLLLGTGVEDILPHLSDPHEVALSDLPLAPSAWHNLSLIAGRCDGVRVWALTDGPSHTAASSDSAWARAWPIWLARAAGAGACLLTTAGSPLDVPQSKAPSEGYLLVSDHIILEGPSALRGLAGSNLGPLFPDQGRVHAATIRRDLLLEATRLGLHASEGILATVPGPALETPAERAYLAHTGADASAQDLGSLFHAMAHTGLGGLTLAVLLGNSPADVEDLLRASERLAPGLVDLISAAIPHLAVQARNEREQEL